MLLANETATLYNRYPAGRDGDRWVRTVLYGVSWYKSVESAVTSSGYQTAQVHKIRIPAAVQTEDGKAYVPDAAFFDADKSTAWTIQTGDKIVRGIASVPPDDIDLDTRLESEYEDAASIVAFADNRRGDACGQHWRIEAV